MIAFETDAATFGAYVHQAKTMLPEVVDGQSVYDSVEGAELLATLTNTHVKVERAAVEATIASTVFARTVLSYARPLLYLEEVPSPLLVVDVERMLRVMDTSVREARETEDMLSSRGHAFPVASSTFIDRFLDRRR